GDSMTFSTSFAVKQFDMAVNPKHVAHSLVTVSGIRNNYFNHFDRDSRRYDASATLAIAMPSAFGDHLVKAGGQVAHTSYDGIDNSRAVAIVGPDGPRLRQIEYVGSAEVGASNTDIAGFIEDEWALNPRVTLHGGVRYGYERIAGEQTLAPRADIS